MTFWDHFLRLLFRRPVAALAALYWHVTRRKVRALNRLRVASTDLPFAYQIWIANNEPTPESRQTFDAVMRAWTRRPSFAVIVHSALTSDKDDRRRSIDSVERQIYPDWQLIEAAALSKATFENFDDQFVIPLAAGNVLADWALFRFAEALQDSPDAAILYGDEDRLDERERRMKPWFKPRWNEELFLAQDYLSRAVAIETRLAKQAASESKGGLAEFLLIATSAAKEIVHVPHIVVHVPASTDAQPRRIDAVARHVELQGAACAPGPFGTVKVCWPLPSELPLVSIIVPTKDKLNLLQPCIEGVLQRTSYSNFEILIVDNGSIEDRTAEYLHKIKKNPQVRVLAYSGSYNFSAINNWAAHHARGSFLCLLNNDTEVLGPEWLTEMMRYAVKPEIGAVGAKLLYEDGSIQHAGVVVGIGEAAGHAHRFLPAHEPGYFHMAHVAQFVSAVTAACLLVEKEKFEAVGGLDADKLAIAFNDVDFCLKLQERGWRNVYVPHALLVHYESRSRGRDFEPAQIARYRRELAILQERWGSRDYMDPLHNPNLDRQSETYVFRL